MKKLYIPIIILIILSALTASYFWLFPARELSWEDKEKLVNLQINGWQHPVYSNAQTVGEFLNNNNINIKEKDQLFPDPQTKLIAGMAIGLKRATKVKIAADGEEKEIQSLGKTVDDVLNEAGISVSHLDQVTPSKESFLHQDLEIIVTRINVEEVTEEKEIDFETIEKEDDDLAWRKKKVKIKGEKGIKKITYRVTYKNGVEESKEKINSETTKEPVDEVVVTGTKIKVGKTKKGRASWYAWTGTMACAARMWPRGTWLRVTNVENGKQIFVVVNDYGPQRGTGKMIDLDKVAFEKLAPAWKGVIEVKVEEILE